MTENRVGRLLVVFVTSALAATVGLAQEKSPTPEPSPSPAPRFQPEVVKALPTAGSLTARVVQLNAGLVTGQAVHPFYWRGLWESEIRNK